MTLTFRWLGVAGLEFNLDGQTLLIDPFFTRPSPLAVLTGRRVASDRAEIARRITRAAWVLVTHPHYDHLMDVPEVLRLTGARAYGSPNTCALLARHGHASTCVAPGDWLALGPFTVEVFPADHTRIPFARWLNAPLIGITEGLDKEPQRPLPGPTIDMDEQPQRPLPLSDYRMDACYSFRIQAGGKTLLVGNHPVAAEVVFLSPYRPARVLAELLAAIQPRLVVPIHWDDFMEPLSKPLRPMLHTTAQGLQGFPPVRRVSLVEFARQVQAGLPSARVVAPEIFKEYGL